MPLLSDGANMPHFTLPAVPGPQLSHTDFAGAPAVFFLFPRASTPACTSEARAFTSLSGAFAALGARVAGMSDDGVKKLTTFRTRQELSVDLISDTDRTLIGALGAWGEKKLYGRTYEGLIRSTFLFDASGTLVRSWAVKRVEGHAQEVLDAAKALNI